MTVPDDMIVATVFGWVWRDLEAGVAGRWPVRHDRGVCVPEVRHDRTAWWTPTAHAARLVAAGLDLHLAATPPGWLATLDRELTGRTIHALALADAVALADAGELPTAGFVKPTLAKLDALEARWCDDLSAALRTAATGGVHPDTVVEVTGSRLEIAVEHRTFVLDGQVTRPSPYRIGTHTWEPEFDDRDDTYRDDAWAFAAAVAADLAARDAAPRAYVLDVARTAAGRWLVVETNAAWSAGTYGCDLSDVADAAAAASTPPGDPRWRWQPDPSEADAARTRPLPRTATA